MSGQFHDVPNPMRQASYDTPATASRYGRDTWATQFGAVVAESGGNKITLENYGRKHEEGSNLPNETIYYFRCMGLHPPVVNRGTRRGMPG